MQPADNAPQQPALPSVPPVGNDQGAALPFAEPAAAGQPVPAPQNTAPAGTTPDLADDGDLIEKDWVMKVKQVMGATSHDPFEQNNQFTKLKADYMLKRYGKIIKSED